MRVLAFAVSGLVVLGIALGLLTQRQPGPVHANPARMESTDNHDAPAQIPTVVLPQAPVEVVTATEVVTTATVRPPDALSPEAPLNSLFAGDLEPVADSWRYRAAVYDVLKRATGLGVSVESLDCRLRVCKLKLNFKDKQSDLKVFHDVFLKGTSTELPDGLGAFAVPTRREMPDGTEAVTVYLARQGELSVPGGDDMPVE